MAELISSRTDVFDSHGGNGTFLVTEVTDGEPSGAPSPGDDFLTEEHPWIAAGPNGLVVQMRMEDSEVTPIEHRGRAHVRLELWDEKPSSLPAGWEMMWTGGISVGSGTIALLDFFVDDNEREPFSLGRVDAQWSVRVYLKIMHNEADPEFPGVGFSAELYKMQFWAA
jgi:hypothetical protein